MMINRYSMNKALVGALFKLHRRPHVKAGDIGFTKVEYSVYTKLKFWDLIKSEFEDGLWSVTPHGRAFLFGKVKVPKTIGYFRNRLEEQSDDMVSIFEVFPTEESRQKYRDMASAFEGQKI